MICQLPPRGARGPFVVTPKTSFRPYRIQLRDDDSPGWRLYATFEFLGEAEACLDGLRQRGIDAQLVSDYEPLMR